MSENEPKKCPNCGETNLLRYRKIRWQCLNCGAIIDYYGNIKKAGYKQEITRGTFKIP